MSVNDRWPTVPPGAVYVKVWEVVVVDERHCQQTLALGRMLGLPSEVVAETVAVWREYHERSGQPLSWARIRDAVTDRAAGDLWRPGEVSRGMIRRAGLEVSPRGELAAVLGDDTPGGP